MHPMDHDLVFTEEQAQARDAFSAHLLTLEGVPHRYAFTNDQPDSFNFCVLGRVQEQIRMAQPEKWMWSDEGQDTHFLIPVEDFPFPIASNSFLWGREMERVYGIVIDEEQALQNCNDHFAYSWRKLALLWDERTKAIRRQIRMGIGLPRLWDTFFIDENTRQKKWFVVDLRNGDKSDPVAKFNTYGEANTYVMANVPLEEVVV